MDLLERITETRVYIAPPSSLPSVPPKKTAVETADLPSEKAHWSSVGRTNTPFWKSLPWFPLGKWLEHLWAGAALPAPWNGCYVYWSRRSATRLNLLVHVTSCSSQAEGLIETQSRCVLSKHLPPAMALREVFIALAQMIPPEVAAFVQVFLGLWITSPPFKYRLSGQIVLRGCAVHLVPGKVAVAAAPLGVSTAVTYRSALFLTSLPSSLSTPQSCYKLAFLRPKGLVFSN